MKRKLITLTLATTAILGAQTFQGWAQNFILAAFWSAGQGGNVLAQVIYQSLVEGGSPCFTWHGSSAPTSPQPACYDPNNTNDGYLGPVSANHGPNMPPDPWDWAKVKAKFIGG